MPAHEDDLYLHEQIMLLALRDDKGTIESRAGMYSYALAGAILSELLLAERIRVTEDKKKLVDLVSHQPMNEPVMDECLGLIATAKRRRKAADWVARFTRVRNLRHRVAEGLCRRGILRDSEDKVLLIFTRRIYPEIDPAPERRLVERLREAIFSDAADVEPRTAIVLSLAHGTGMLGVHFDRKELKTRKRRIEQIANGDLIGGATREAVQAAQAAAQAAQAAIIAATVATTVVTTH
jgi:hypothetical protein